MWNTELTERGPSILLLTGWTNQRMLWFVERSLAGWNERFCKSNIAESVRESKIVNPSMISVSSFWMKTFQSSILAALVCVHVMTGRVDGSGTWVLKSQAISPSRGRALLAATVGIGDEPSVHVRLSHGCCVDKPSVLVNVIRASDESLVINATER